LKVFIVIKAFFLPARKNKSVFPAGSKVFPNDFGRAPGAIVEKDGKYCIILPALHLR
jgi:molybdopterin-biosynthesis enzyme MoeA-like protein